MGLVASRQKPTLVDQGMRAAHSRPLATINHWAMIIDYAATAAANHWRLFRRLGWRRLLGRLNRRRS